MAEIDDILSQLMAQPNEMTPKYREGGKPMTSTARKADALDKVTPTPSVAEQLLQKILAGEGGRRDEITHPLNPERPELAEGSFDHARRIYEKMTGNSDLTDGAITAIELLASELEGMAGGSVNFPEPANPAYLPRQTPENDPTVENASSEERLSPYTPTPQYPPEVIQLLLDQLDRANTPMQQNQRYHEQKRPPVERA